MVIIIVCMILVAIIVPLWVSFSEEFRVIAGILIGGALIIAIVYLIASAVVGEGSKLKSQCDAGVVSACIEYNRYLDYLLNSKGK